MHNKNLQVNTQYGGIGLTPKINTNRIYHTRAELNAYLRKNPSTPEGSIFVIRSGWESQYLARGEVQPRSALFEDKPESVSRFPARPIFG